MEYLPAENVMVIKKKEHFYSLTETEHSILPVLTMQVWDNDIFTPDDFIGKHIHSSKIHHEIYAWALPDI